MLFYSVLILKWLHVFTQSKIKKDNSNMNTADDISSGIKYNHWTQELRINTKNTGWEI